MRRMDCGLVLVILKYLMDPLMTEAFRRSTKKSIPIHMGIIYFILLKGLPNGIGVMRFPDSSRYEGEFMQVL